MNVDYVYGGGSECGYAPDTVVANGYFTTSGPVPGTARPNTPFVYVRRGTVNRAVFGGGKGSASMPANTTVKSNPTVMIGLGTGASASDLPVIIGDMTGKGDVYGGGNQMEVEGNTHVVIDGSKTIVRHNVYGGGNQAKVHGDTDVRIGDPTDKTGVAETAITVPTGTDTHYGEAHYSLAPGECKTGTVVPEP